MKRTIYILAILTIAALLPAACKSTDISDQPQASATSSQPQPAAQQTAQTQEPEPSVNVPADTYKILATDTADKFLMKYKIDPDNKWKVKTATFEMRNFGDAAVTPKITFMVGAGSAADMKTFEYDAIPAGYKMIKQETVNMDVEDEHVFIKATFTDKATGKEIESVNLDYFAK